MRKSATFCLPLVGIVAVFAGCASYSLRERSGPPATETRADERGLVTGSTIESHDLATVAEKIAHQILSAPEIANAKGAPRIVLLPLKNDSRFPINKDLFLERIAAVLNDKSAGKVRFVVRDRAAESDPQRAVTSNTDPRLSQLKGADFMLTSKLTSATRAAAATSDYVVYSFTLIDPNTSDIVCQKSHQISKQGLASTVYR